MCERELETKQRLQHIDLPSPSGHVSFPFSWTAQLVAWGPSLSGTCSHPSIFSPTDSKLTDFLSSSSYIIVQSPTQYLPITVHRDVWLSLSSKWHVWLSSSGNNCRAVHRSLSSGASVYDCTTGFYLVPYFQPTRLRQSNMQLLRLWSGLSGLVEGQYTTTTALYWQWMLSRGSIRNDHAL